MLLVPDVGEKKATIVVLLILSLVLISLQNVRLVKADNTVHIMANGIVKGTDRIARNNDTYTFTGDIFSAIIIERNYTTVDGNGYKLQGSGSGNGLTLQGPEYTLLQGYLSNVTIKNMQIQNFERGIVLNNCKDCNISGNSLTSNTIGMYLVGSPDIIITKNNITNNRFRGLQLYVGSHGYLISGNNISSNEKYGFVISDSSRGNIISKNTISNNSNGLNIEHSWGNIITENNITDNKLGIRLLKCYDNTLYLNSFDNYEQIYVEYALKIDNDWSNQWDNGTIGNFWSDYTGDDADDDGIGETPYVINDENYDNYPLMPPFEAVPSTEPQPKEPFPTTLIIASIITVAIVGVLLVYFKKRKH